MKLNKEFVFLAFATLGLAACGPNNTRTAEATQPTLSVAKSAEAARLNVQLGLGYLQQGKRELAKTKLLAALQHAPNSAQANDAMAYFFEATGDYDKADSLYKKAVQLAPGQGAPLNNYGTYLCRRGQYAQSEGYFMSAIKDPNYVNIADAYENAGLCTLQIPDVDKARHYFELALKQDPARGTSLLELSEISFNQGQYPQAQQYLKQYSEVAPASSESTWMNYQVAKQLGLRSDAVSAAMLLKSKFSDSKEFQSYQSSQGKRIV